MNPILTVALYSEFDVIASRQRARQIAAFCGFDRQDQTRLSTLVSELARIACAEGGLVQFSLAKEAGQQSLVVLVQSNCSVREGSPGNVNNVFGHQGIRGSGVLVLLSD